MYYTNDAPFESFDFANKDDRIALRSDLLTRQG